MFKVVDYGAAGDGRTPDTRAIQAALDGCGRAGGGVVRLPAGAYVSGSLRLHSGVMLYLEEGAALLGSEDPADYPIVESRWEGAPQRTHAPLIGGQGLHSVGVVGSGTIDGRGAGWWQRHRERTLDYPRPRLISLEGSRNVLIEGITAINSPAWTIHPLGCEDVTVRGITIRNPADSPNTDGINPESCRNVNISGCQIDVGDDCIAIKSGTEKVPAEQRRPCENITITGCTMAHGHGGVVIGSEMSGGVRNVAVSNCVFAGTDRGIRLKSRRGRGGVVEDVRADHITMNGVLCPFTANLYYACGAWGDEIVSDRRPRPAMEGTPVFRRISLSHITATDAACAAAFLYGLPEAPVEDVTLEEVSIEMAAQAEPAYPEMADGLEPMARAGFYARNVRGLRMERVKITGQVGPAFDVVDCAGVQLRGSADRAE